MLIRVLRDHGNSQALSWAAPGSGDLGWVGSPVMGGLPGPPFSPLAGAWGLSPGLLKRGCGHGDTKWVWWFQEMAPELWPGTPLGSRLWGGTTSGKCPTICGGRDE